MHHRREKLATLGKGWETKWLTQGVKSSGHRRPVLLLPLHAALQPSLWLRSLIRSLQSNRLGKAQRSWSSSDAHTPCQALSTQRMPLTRSMCDHLTARLLSDSLTGHADGPEARWHPEHAPGSVWGSATGTDVRASHPTCRTATDGLGFPPSEPENLKAGGQPHVTLSFFYVRLFLSLGVSGFGRVVGEMKYSAVVD